MPKRTKSQVIGEIGQKIVEVQVTGSSEWLANNITPDYGIDLELQLSLEEEEVEPRFIKAQIKSHKLINESAEFITERLEKSFLRFAYQCRIPIILIIVSTSTQKSWYVWVQKWLIESNKFLDIYDESQKEKLSIKIPTCNNFVEGLKKDLKFIALLLDRAQLYISVRELATLPSALYDEALSDFLFKYLDKLDKPKIENDYINYLIARFIDLGEYVGKTNEGSRVINLLFDYIKKHGTTIKREHITKLVSRGKWISPKGINILGCLYDNYPEYVLSLNLIDLFREFSPLLHYYCTIRERYIHEHSSLWFDPNHNLTVGNLTLNLPTNYLNKWANRGDSFFLHYIIKL
ncbi:DUF4365 domain-containing protein [Legionella bozemanae]|uniref:DUF4365 domain-containing protein n=1 Tax=Legionella bozemanae TaxID=447 RepID=UPI0010413EB6|nr:DUF4365 domain-containing protein [Legionella bozemanae]